MKAQRAMAFSKSNNLGYRSEGKKLNASTRQKITVTLFLVLFLCLGILLTPMFSVKTITVSGNNYISADKVLELSEAKVGKNIFLFRTDEVEEKIKELSFADTVNVERKFPDTVNIEIKECTPVSQIMCGQSLFIVIDDKGKILDTASDNKKYAVPAIKGVEIDSFTVGDKIQLQNDDELTKVLGLLKELSNCEMLSTVSGVYIKDGELHAKFGENIDCNFEYGDNLPYRVKFVKECIEKIPEEKVGEIRFMENYRAVFTETVKGEEIKNEG